MITKEVILHVAKLAHLAVSESETATLTRQLDEIFQFAESLNRWDTAGVSATAHAFPQATRFREDAPHRFENRNALLTNAPDSENGFFGVPKI
jgi:aspartyl-tRNA(Asn)/glutamyl-tRNA(Gln) amidotransferase subunit C